MKKETMYHYWNAETKKHVGVSKSLSCDISQGGLFVHQACEIEIPECPSPLTDAEKLEKLVEAANLVIEHREDNNVPWEVFRNTMEVLRALIKEYSK